MRFSRRIGKTPVRTALQVDSMDQALRNSLWNVLYRFLFNREEWEPYEDIMDLWEHFFKQPIDSVPGETPKAIAAIRKWFFECPWYLAYDFVEFAATLVKSPRDFYRACNVVLEREASGYRFLNGILTPIADQIDIQNIETAIGKTGSLGMEPVQRHLESALRLLSDRRSPDYRNSIKEAISAVEAMARLISGDPKAQLAKALDILGARIGLHGALKKGFQALYGWTGHEQGIRHAMTDQPTVEFEDALYMLGACSAFVHYLLI
ncbi:MAG: AbiJ-NTD4 domain-containing protein [Bacillota bacterium]